MNSSCPNCKIGEESVIRAEQKFERREGKWQTNWCRPCKMAQALAKKLDHTGLVESERLASLLQSEQLARM